MVKRHKDELGDDCHLKENKQALLRMKSNFYAFDVSFKNTRVKVKSAYEQRGRQAGAYFWFLQHEMIRSISSPPECNANP